MLYMSLTGTVSLMVTVVPLAGVTAFCRCIQNVFRPDSGSTWITVWFAPAVTVGLAFQSSPTPITNELAPVVTRLAVGDPAAALPDPVAPIAPEPLVPELITPLKLITVIEETLLRAYVAVTVTFVNGAVANARQISAVPDCEFVLFTNCQVNPPPVTLFTAIFADDWLGCQSAPTNASNNSLPDVVENAAVSTVLLAEDWSFEIVTSIANGAGGGAVDCAAKLTLT